MADDGAIASNSGDSKRQSTSSIEEVPLRTKRAFDACISRFSDALGGIAAANMKRRDSRTPTDADVEDAYRELMRKDSPGKARRCIGDGALILGGVMLPMWTVSPLVTLSGLTLCAMGLYVREFSK